LSETDPLPNRAGGFSSSGSKASSGEKNTVTKVGERAQLTMICTRLLAGESLSGRGMQLGRSRLRQALPRDMNATQHPLHLPLPAHSSHRPTKRVGFRQARPLHLPRGGGYLLSCIGRRAGCGSCDPTKLRKRQLFDDSSRPIQGQKPQEILGPAKKNQIKCILIFLI